MTLELGERVWVCTLLLFLWKSFPLDAICLSLSNVSLEIFFAVLGRVGIYAPPGAPAGDRYSHGLQALATDALERLGQQVPLPPLIRLDLLELAQIAQDSRPLQLPAALRQPLHQFVSRHERRLVRPAGCMVREVKVLFRHTLSGL